MVLDAVLPTGHPVSLYAVLIAFQAMTLAGMIAVSIWGRTRIPHDARLRVRAGPTGIDWTTGKNWALLKTPLIGVLILVVTLTLLDRQDEMGVAALGFAVMLIFFLAHLSSIKRAAR